MNWQAKGTLHVGRNLLDYMLRGHRPVTCIVGPNGGGKSSILRSICGFNSLRSGFLSISDRICFDSTQGLNSPPEERHLGYVPQSVALFPHLDVYRNIAFGLRYRNISTQQKEQRIEDVLEQFFLKPLCRSRVGQLSGGEAQRVALARAWICKPQLFVLDEPFSALDAGMHRQLRALLKEEARRIPVLMVTHDIRDLIALEPYIYAVENFRIVQEGPLQSFLENPKSTFVQEFFLPLQSHNLITSRFPTQP